MNNPYYTKKNSEKEVMKALKEQRGKYDKTFELWNAKQLELYQKREEKAIAYAQSRKLDPNKTRQPNKTDFFDKI
jgi:hypothetical protein|tara:strand:+ start:163 stop:387 length:225 start_codon:yes stop_codon:yes gene_type:complete